MIKKRIIDEALFIIHNRSTVRETCKYFDVSKSTVHKDVSTRLKKIDMNLYRQVKAILDQNFSEKHIRGGLSTKAKFMQKSTH